MSAPIVFSLNCPNCAAALEVTSTLDRFACGYCGSGLIANRQGGTVALSLVTDAIGRVQQGTDRTAAELAIQRLERELGGIRTKSGQLDQQAAIQIEKVKNSHNMGCLFGGIVVVSAAFGFGSDIFTGGTLLPFVAFVAAFWAISINGMMRHKINVILESLKEQLRPLRAEEAQILDQIGRHKATL